MSGLQYYLSQTRKKETLKGGLLLAAIVLTCAAFLVYGLYSAPANASKAYVCTQDHGQLTCVKR